MKITAAGKRVFVIALILVVLQAVNIVQVSGSQEGIWYYPPTPQGEVGIKRPTILWTFGGIDSADIREIIITVDGEEVGASFSDELNSVVYIPEEPLIEGEHKVSIILTLKEGIKISSPPFSFYIVKGAYDEVPDTPVYQEVRDRINFYRELAGLPAVEIDKSLNAAAYNHCLYLSNNPGAGHYENNKGDPYFSGELPWDRTRYFGYLSPMVAENIHFKASHIKAVDDWMDSLYHRLPLMNPIFTQIGYGYFSKGDRHYNVLEMGAPRYNNLEQAVVVYPAEGQVGVPLTWTGLEEPDPFRLYPGVEGPGGYPVTLVVSGANIEKVELVEAAITGERGEVLEFYSFDSNNDPFLADKNALALIPASKLEPHTRYRVAIKGMVEYNNGKESQFTKEWTFTTGGGSLETYDEDALLRIYLDGLLKEYSPAPFIENGRVLIPVRSFCEELGAMVKWHPKTYTVEIIKGDTVISFDIGSNLVSVNGRLVELDVPARIFKDRTFVPVRFVSEVLGYRVNWDGITRFVLIYSR